MIARAPLLLASLVLAAALAAAPARAERLVQIADDDTNPGAIGGVAWTDDGDGIRESFEALAAGIPVSICGEIAGDAEAVPLLLGLGLQELSAPAPAIPLVKEAVRRSQQTACRTLAEQALRCEDAAAVRALLHGGTSGTVNQ